MLSVHRVVNRFMNRSLNDRFLFRFSIVFINDRFVFEKTSPLEKTIVSKKNLLTIILTIVFKGSSLTILKEGLSLTIVDETMNFRKGSFLEKRLFLKKKIT